MGYIISVAAGLIGGLAAVVLIEQRRNKSRRRTRAKAAQAAEEEKRTTKKIEFSKLVLLAVLLTYFGGFGIGAWVVLRVDYTQLSVLLVYLATPTATAIGFYAWKTKADNAIKLKQRYKEETEGIPVDLNNIQP